jgi:TonB family protein
MTGCCDHNVCHLSTTVMTELRIIARCVLMLAGVAASTATTAQVMAPSAAASAAAERAQKETDRTMYWIRVLAEKPAAKAAAAPKPAAAAPAPQARVAASPEPRVKVASSTPAPAPPSADVANAAPSSVVVAAPGAAAPSLAAATGAASTGNNTAMTSGGLDAGVSGASLAGSLAAPAVAVPPIDVPVVEEAPDPGLIMIKSADPEFPISTMRRLRKGEVEVKFEVSPDGVVDVVTVMKTSNTSLNAAAVEAVRQWRFKPTSKGHTALVDLAFNLDL